MGQSRKVLRRGLACSAIFIFGGLILALVGYGGGIVADVSTRATCNASSAAQTNCFFAQGKDVDQTAPLASEKCTCEVDKVVVQDSSGTVVGVRKWISHRIDRTPPGAKGAPPNCTTLYPPSVRTCYTYEDDRFDSADDGFAYSYDRKRHKGSQGMVMAGSLLSLAGCVGLVMILWIWHCPDKSCLR